MALVNVAEYVQAHAAQRAWRRRRVATAGTELPSLLAHAASTVPAYRGIDARGSGALERFPMLERPALQRLGSSLWSTSYPPASLRLKTTSGTSGRPLQIAWDPASWFGLAYDAYAAIAGRVFGNLAGFRAGSMGLVILNDNPRRTPWTSVNPALGDSVAEKLVLNRDPSLDRADVRRLRRQPIPLVAGRPRTLLCLAEIDEDAGGRGHIRPLAILSSGDNLYPDQRQRLQRHFGCDVYDAYASMEAGVVGVDCREHLGVHVFTDRVAIESRADASADGTRPAIVVTSLINWAMPIIRYVSDDAGVVEMTMCACGVEGPTIRSLAGRDSMEFRIGETRFPPSLVASLLEGLPIESFRAVLDGDTLTIEWVAFGDLGGRDLDPTIRHRLEEQLAPITVATLRCASLPEKAARYVQVR